MATTKTKAATKLIPVLVTTAQKGVFFGYAKEAKPNSAKEIEIENAQLCVSWSTDMQGFMGLAAKGPSSRCKIGPEVPKVLLTDVTSVCTCTEEAAKAWKEQGERKWG